MRTVAVTGGIGSGKSTVCRMFNVLGIPVFEADQVAKRCMVENEALRSALVGRFGQAILQHGQLDRGALAAVVFTDVKALTDLNAMVHPVVRHAFTEWAAGQSAPYVIMEAAIIAETGGHAAFDKVVVVSAPEALRLARVMKRDGVGEEAVQSRMRNQGSEEDRLKIADHVIQNDDLHLIIPQVLELHTLFLS